MSKYTKYFPIICILILSGTALYMGLGRYLSFDNLRSHQILFQDFFEYNKVISILIYSAIYILVVSLSIPSGALFMTITGGVLLGQWLGTITVVFSATIGSTIIFMSTKMASRDLLEKRAHSFIGKMKNGFQENAFSYLLTLRLIPIFPFFVINLAAAVFQIPLRTFVVGTFIGIMPGTFVYTSVGVAIAEILQRDDFTPKLILDPKILFCITGLGILSLLPVFYRIYNRHVTPTLPRE